MASGPHTLTKAQESAHACKERSLFRNDVAKSYPVNPSQFHQQNQSLHHLWDRMIKEEGQVITLAELWSHGRKCQEQQKSSIPASTSRCLFHEDKKQSLYFLVYVCLIFVILINILCSFDLNLKSKRNLINMFFPQSKQIYECHCFCNISSSFM